MIDYEYDLIKRIYGDRVAERTQVPLIKHIDEGLAILRHINATLDSRRAFCLHPIFQNDVEFMTNCSKFLTDDRISKKVMLLALEYRRAANAYLCKPYTDDWGQVEIGEAVGYLLPEVKKMLIADKRQNMDDFMTFHFGKHKRSDQLHQYFLNWLEYLA